MNARDIAYGYAIGYNDGLGSGGETSDDWQPPADWLPVPEPKDYEMYFLVNVTNAPNEYFRLNIAYASAYTGDDTFTIDWGNGEIVDAGGHGYTYYTYYYPENGQFLIKATVSAQNSICPGIIGAVNSVPILIAKFGKKISLSKEDIYQSRKQGFYNQQYLHYVKINSPDGLPVRNDSLGAFEGCVRLRKVDLKTPAKVIPKRCFYNCYDLIKFDFSETVTIEDNALNGCGIGKINLPNCTSIGSSGSWGFKNNVYLKEFSAPLITDIWSNCFAGCRHLKKVNAPNCVNIADRAFWQCYRLGDIQYAEGCVIAGKAFEECYRIYDVPETPKN